MYFNFYTDIILFLKGVIMPFSIKVTSYETQKSWEKNLTSEEFNQVYCFCQKSRNAVSMVDATLMPVRTDNLKNFSKDFFAPTVANYAIKVQGIVKKIFVILLALIIDAISFPFRLLTCIPRIIYNAKQEIHPLHKYLKQQQDVDDSILKTDHVLVKLNWEKVNPYNFSRHVDPQGVEHKEYHKNYHSEEKPINFKDLHKYEGSLYLRLGV